MQTVLISPTFGLGHHGCTLVDRQLVDLSSQAGLAIVRKLPLNADWQRWAPASFDLVLVNGEGALHHNSEAAKQLAKVPLWAHGCGKPAFLINTVYQANGPDVAGGIARYDAVFARDQLSKEALARDGIAAGIVPDLTLSWKPALRSGGGQMIVVTDSAVRDENSKLHAMARATGARYLPLIARPPAPIIAADANFSRWWRYAVKRIAARAAPDGLWRDRYLCLMPEFDQYIAWMAENAGLVVAGRFHGVCIALALRIPFLAVPSNTWKIEALLSASGLSCRLVTNLDEVQHQLETQGIRRFVYTPGELERIATFCEMARTDAGAMFQSIRQIASTVTGQLHVQ